MELYYGFNDFFAIMFAAKSQTGRLKEETNQMVKEKNRICSQILAKQKRIATLESDSSTLTQVVFILYFLAIQTDIPFFHSINSLFSDIKDC